MSGHLAGTDAFAAGGDANTSGRWPPLALAALTLAAIAGAAAVAFHCDDAFIAFRYVSNARDGHGLVWNAPPFQPVEGYTSFLWVLLLWATWSWSGVEPPAAVNVLSIALTVGTLWLVFAQALRVRRRDGARASPWLAIVASAWLVANPTFLQWATSGLETALFDLLVVAWAIVGCRARAARTTGWLAGWSACAALVALTRPDGLLFVATTGAAALIAALRRERTFAATLLGLAPLAAVLVHLAARRAYYGEWLPNTYYAKVVRPWPEAGVRYLTGFVVEHGVWVWLAIAAAWALAQWRRLGARTFAPAADALPALATAAALAAHVGYYTLIVGGDHFEWRVFSHLLPLGALSAAAMAAALCRTTRAAVLLLSALGAAASVAWVPYAVQHGHASQMPYYERVEPHVPGWLGWLVPLARWYDRNQAWLSMHFVCGRCEQHAVGLRATYGLLPERTRLRPDPDDLPVIETDAAGLPGWVLPDVAVLDRLGLSDWVVARSRKTEPPVPFPPADAFAAAVRAADQDRSGALDRREIADLVEGFGQTHPDVVDALVTGALLLFARERDDAITLAETDAIPGFFADLRFMAHERSAPPGYVADLDPNVAVKEQQVRVRRRDVPLTAERVRAIEAKWRERVRAADPR